MWGETHFINVGQHILIDISLSGILIRLDYRTAGYAYTK